jgi:RNA polymerase sigma-70 factor, ECF subfamily
VAGTDGWDTLKNRMTPSRAASQGEGVVLPLGFAGDDRALVEALRANHPGAKAALFQRHVGWVERLITHVIGFDAELADILQEVFTRALGSIHTLKDPSALEPWLGRVATHTARKVLRTRTRRAWLRRFVDSSEEERYEPAALAFAPEARQALRAVYRVLDVLPADERIAFALRFIDGMELTEVAASCDVSLATIKRRLVRSEKRFVAVAARYPELSPWLEGGAKWRDR